MMRLRNLTFALLVVAAFPAVCSAGWIAFDLGPGNLIFASPSPGADTALVLPTPPPNPHYFDTGTGTPVLVNILSYVPQLLPASPAWATTRPDGTVHWDVGTYFGLPLTLTDVASGQSATFTFYGQGRLVGDYAPATGWTGYADFSSPDWQQVRLGGNLYTVWGIHTTHPTPASVDVWVGNGTPPAPQYTPEPATFALVALGLVPLGMRRLRRMW